MRGAGTRLLFACLLGLPAAAWASYGQMKLDGIASAFFLCVLFLWGVIVGILAVAELFKSKIAMGVVLAITAVLVALLALTWDGNALFARMPLSTAAVLALRVMLTVPLLLVIPYMLHQHWQEEGAHRRNLAIALLLGASLTPVEGAAWWALQEAIGKLASTQAQATAPGRVQEQLALSRDAAAFIPFKPWVWTETENLRYTAMGLAALPWVQGADPLASRDRVAFQQLVERLGPQDTWRILGKLAWDAFLPAGGMERLGQATNMDRYEAGVFAREYAARYAARLCPTFDAATEKALWVVMRKTSAEEEGLLRDAIRAQCGKTLPAVPR